jgi:hypothetical protein
VCEKRFMGRKIMAAVLLIGFAVSSIPGKAKALDIKVPDYLRLSNYRFTTEAERREMARTTIENKNQKLKTLKLELNKINSPLLPQKGKDLFSSTYKLSLNINLTNLHAHATDYWYKWKDQRKGIAVSSKNSSN